MKILREALVGFLALFDPGLDNSVSNKELIVQTFFVVLVVVLAAFAVSVK